MKLKAGWKVPVDGRLLGAFLNVVNDRVIYQYLGPQRMHLAALQHDGSAAWRSDWPRLHNHFVHDGVLYTGGVRARRVDAATGTLLSERDFGDRVTIRPPVATGPVYWTQGRIMGLEPADLSVAWEAPDPEEQLTAHDGRLCRYLPDGRMSHIDLQTMQESMPVPAPPRNTESAAFHAHVDGLWCHFYMAEGGRLGIDEATGEIRWQHADPGGHGIAAFRGDRAYSGGKGGVAAYDLRSGRELWHQPGGSATQPLIDRPHVEGGRVYGGTRDGFVMIMDANSGELVVSQQVDLEPESVRPLGSDRVVVAGRNAIHCFEIS